MLFWAGSDWSGGGSSRPRVREIERGQTSDERALGRLILVIEDSPETAQAVRAILELEGYRVRSAPNGREALDAIEREVPDLILLDLWMPVMSGREFLAALRRRDPPLRDIPVVALTADFRAAVEDLPVQSVLLKPIDLKRLLTTLRGL
jgi:CheY-like chemotaxis protein